MIYRPNFCCQCGEKVVRDRWTLLTSRRFCDFCAIEQKQHDLLPRAILIIAVVAGVAGLTTFISSGNSSEPPQARSGRPVARANVDTPPKHPVNAMRPDANTSTATPMANGARPVNTVQRQQPGNSSTESVYYCGAMTKKGTPCTRRVRSKVRCWQHAGEPAVAGSR